ncbi:MerR family transcriptional regulator [Sphingomonas morindae]|uniref:MerR family transcriptional regulator n=1 Tax=Sphingomonas morindae TaxID=1541170 RepID=UPI003F5D4F26
MTKSDTAFKTIGEVSAALGVPQHVLRYWETRFPQLKPLTRAGNRRYYRPEDVALARHIQSLLGEQGYTVRGVQKLLADAPAPPTLTPTSAPAPEGGGAGANGHAATAPPAPSASAAPQPGSPASAAPDPLLDELRAIRDLLAGLLADEPSGASIS